MRKIRVMSIFGTRPEAIKMAPVVKALESDEAIESIVCVTAQHREMLDQVLEIFDITPDYDLNIMKAGQTLSDITTRVLDGLQEVIKQAKPDLVLVHGDTTTTFSGALAAFYNGVKVGHVEAGLRSGDKYSPFPEEMNRSLTGRIAELHFAPTVGNFDNLSNEGICHSTIIKTGNTVIDALKEVIDKNYIFENDMLNNIDFESKKIITMTAHRRENLGQPMENIFSAVREIATTNDDVVIVFPMHLNPAVRDVARKHLGDLGNVMLIEPLDYQPFANLIDRSYMILTDSGGIQEEAPALGKPVLVLRTETERPEAVEAGTVKMAGVEKEDIVREANLLIRDESAYRKMSEAVNPYGDGFSSKRIVEAIKEYFNV